MEDSKIVELYNQRNEDAIAQSRSSYGRALHALAYRILCDEEDASECESDTYFKAWNSIPPAVPKSLKAYLLAICRNAALSMAEKRSAAKRSACVVELTAEMEQCIPDAKGEFELEEDGIGACISAFLRGESYRNRVIFVKRYYYALPVAEIAKQLGASESLVKSSLHRTRGKLREYLKEEGIWI